MTFYNTTNETGDLLQEYKDITNRQELRILEMFEYHKSMSPSQVFKLYMGSYPNQMVPLTSIRRAITNLTNSGLLVKTSSKQKGIFGRNEYIWEKA